MIPFIDLKAQFLQLEDEIRAGIDAVLSHGKFIMGPEVRELEERLADFAGVKHAITCSSGTDALLMPLMAQKIGPGDAVFTTPFTFIATAEVITLLGATPVFVDIDPRTFNIDPAKLKLAIQAVKANEPEIHPLPYTSHPEPLLPKAIIPVDLFGLPADFGPIMEIAKEENLFVLEDAAQGFGGVYKGRKAGGLAHAGAVSFFPAKPLGCYGDGGAVLTDDDELAAQLSSIRAHGKGTEKYDNVRLGLNARLDTLQAAILLPKLKVFPQEIEARQNIAEQYTRLLASSNAIATPYIPPALQSAWAQYSIICEDRDSLQAALKEAGVPTMVYYPKSLHQQKAYKELHYKEGAFPVAEKTPKHILSLPMHPYLDTTQVEKICEAITKSLK